MIWERRASYNNYIDPTFLTKRIDFMVEGSWYCFGDSNASYALVQYNYIMLISQSSRKPTL